MMSTRVEPNIEGLGAYLPLWETQRAVRAAATFSFCSYSININLEGEAVRLPQQSTCRILPAVHA